MLRLNKSDIIPHVTAKKYEGRLLGLGQYGGVKLEIEVSMLVYEAKHFTARSSKLLHIAHVNH